MDEFTLIVIMARLYQPDNELISISATINVPKGSPIERCLNTFFLRSRFFSQ